MSRIRIRVKTLVAAALPLDGVGVVAPTASAAAPTHKAILHKAILHKAILNQAILHKAIL